MILMGEGSIGWNDVRQGESLLYMNKNCSWVFCLIVQSKKKGMNERMMSSLPQLTIVNRGGTAYLSISLQISLLYCMRVQ